MNQTEGFNEATVNWQASVGSIDNSAAPQYQAVAEDIDTFQRDGVVLLRGAFNDWVETLSSGLQRNLDNPHQFAFPCESNPDGKPGRFFDSYCNWQLIPEYLDYITHSCAASMAGQFMCGKSAQFFHEHAFLKAPGTQHATPWHQDLPYYCVDGTQTASVYVSLDVAAADVAVRFVKGSHHWNKLYYPRVFLDGADFEDRTRDPNMEAVPDIDALPEDFDIAAWSLQPGDAIIFDFRTLHGTSNAEIKSVRRAFSSRWMGDDVVYCERPGETSPPYTNHGMQSGDRMREDWFPVLWRDANPAG
ncbi:MAG: phytanoyl-CoA dioxygenase family protein [Gammaproteobacteria bacterium]